MPITTVLRHSTNLDAGLTATTVNAILMGGDSQAHRFEVTCYRGIYSNEVDLTEATISAYFTRADGTTVLIAGAVENGRAVVTLPADCYAVTGRFTLVIKAGMGDVVETILMAMGAVARSNSDEVLDPDGAITSLEAAIEAFGKGPDMTQFGLPVLYLTGDISPIRESKENKVTVGYTYGDMTGTATLKGQGASSYDMAHNLGERGKYNYTIKFDQAFEAATGWGVQQKYCLKANFIDHTHARNLVSAKLWGQIVKSRATENTNLSGLVNGGAVDGFPIVIMLNDRFHGLYTFNIPKDGWMMGLVEDATKQQAIVGAEEHTTATQFKGLLAGDGSDFEVEFASDEANAEWVTTSLNTMIQACIDARVSTVDAVFDQYLDLDSVVDYLIWVVVIKGSDMVDKNYLLTTFDGVKWCFTAYDMDSTYGLSWDGSSITKLTSNTLLETAAWHRAYELVKRYKTDALQARYAELRADILSENNMVRAFENFAWAIPAPVLMKDVERYPAVPGSSVANIDQICRWLEKRLEIVDGWFAKLPAQEVPFELITQPVSATAAVGDKVSFTVEAVGVASYQWQFSSNNGSTWSDSTATGARTNTLSNYEVTSARLSYKFRCKLTDYDGNVVYTDVVGINQA